MYDSELLTEEILGLERNSNGKIDHPDGGKSGSKDCSDAVCGALWNASQNAEQFAFDYGEDLDNISTVNTQNATMNLNQITVDFENELKQVFTGLDTSKEAKKMDFGFGPAVPMTGEFISQGIMVW